MRYAVAVVAVFVCTIVRASDPGQPLDCSDWEPAVPGVVCREAVPMPCTDSEGHTNAVCNIGNPAATDNDGYTYYLTYEREFPLVCLGQTSMALLHAIVRRARNGTDELVGRFRGRCGSQLGQVDELMWSHDCSSSSPAKFTFDPSRGSLQLGVCSYCEQENGNYPACNSYGEISSGIAHGSVHRIALEGLTTIYEIQESFTPQPKVLAFRVPLMPEGMPAADHFSTFTGPLTNPINFATAQPLACNYPAAPPHVGDFLTVADPLPDPAPGTGRYYVTSATYQGATRYGRQRMNHVTTGRDPAFLPACTP